MTLKQKVLVLYATVTVVTLTAVGGWLTHRFQRDRLDDLQEELLIQLKHIDFALTNLVSEAEADVAALSANDLVRTRADQEFTRFLDADPETFVYNVSELEQSIIDLFNALRLTHPYINSVYMGRENGSFVRSHPRAEATQYDPRARPWYVLARDHPGRIMRTAPYPSLTTTDVNIGVVTALVDDAGQVFGVVGADVTLANLTDYLSDLDIGHGAQVLLLDEEGTVLAARDGALRFQPITQLVDDGAAPLLHDPQGMFSFTSAGGMQRLFHYTSPSLGWKIAIVVPEANIRSETRSSVVPGIAGLLLGVLLLSGLTYIGLNIAVLEPLMSLQRVTSNITKTGNLEQGVEIRQRDEIGSLAASFNEMVRSMQRTQEELRRERDLAQALKDATAALTTTLDSEVVLDRILEQMSRVIPYEAGNIMLIDGDTVRAARWVGYERFGAEAYISQATFELREVRTFREMASGKAPLLVPDITLNADWLPSPQTTWVRSYAGAPMIIRDQVIGFVSVDSSRPGFFEESHLDALRTFADHAAAAIENARLFEQVQRDAVELEERVADATQELRRRAVELEILYEVGKEITAASALDAMLQVIVDSAARMLDADRSLLVLLDVNKGRLLEIVGHGYDPALLQAHTFGELQSGLTGWVLQEKVPTLTNDLQHDERQKGAALTSIRKSTDRSAAIAPLLITDEVLGTLTVVNGPGKRDVGLADLNLVMMLASQAAIAIQKAQLYEAAQEADRLKSAFLASMSHELRTPLNSIIGFTGILLQGLVGPLNDEQRKQLGMVMNSARHLLALINDVLDISKIESGELDLPAEPFSVPEAIRRTAQTVGPLAERKGLPIVVEIAPEIGQMIGDQRRVEQILINLVNNAIKFTDKGQVRIRGQVDGDTLTIQVIDTGIGIRSEDVDKLFRPFRQIDAGTARLHEGTGLGLAICDNLVSMMGGRIGVESEWGKGSTFTVTLPIGGRR